MAEIVASVRITADAQFSAAIPLLSNERVAISIFDDASLIGTVTVQRRPTDKVTWRNWINHTSFPVEDDNIGSAVFEIRIGSTAYTSGAATAEIRRSTVRH